MVCLVDSRHHDLDSDRLTVDDLTRLPHAVAAFGAGNLTPVDRIFGEFDIERRIQITVAGWLPLPFVIEGTDLVAVLPAKLARLHTGAGGPLRQLELPFDDVLLAEGYWFARDRLADPAHRWLFARLDEVAEVLAHEKLEP
jgi:DNA-binding transcriptional LysR family regulator